MRGPSLPGASARTIYFPQPPAGVNVGGGRRDRLLVRPSTVVIYPHGWLVTGLRWSGWGTATAHASGWSLESSKNLTTACEPHCSGGTFERSPASVALWSPGPFHGHTVYRCFRVSDQGSAPDVPSAEGGCSTGARYARHPALGVFTRARSRASSSRPRRAPPGPAPMRPVAW